MRDSLTSSWSRPSHETAQNFLIVSVLAFLAALICLLRLHTYDEPLERDITFYALNASEVLAGRQLYSDIWEVFPPAITATYLIGQVLAGYGPSSVYFLGVTAAVVTLVGVYRAASVKGVGPGLLAAALWTVISGDLALQANQPNTEVFVNTCLIWAFACLVRNDHRTLTVWKSCGIGALLAVATLYKQVAVVPAVALLGAHWAIPSDVAWDRRRAFRQVLTIAAAGATLGLGVFLYFVATGRLSDLWDHLVLFNLYYARSLTANLMTALRPRHLYPEAMFAVFPLAVLAGVGAILGMRKRPSRTGLLLFAYALSVEIAILLPGRFFAHYYQYWLPILVVAAAWALARISHFAAEKGRYVLLAAGGVVLGILALLQAPNYMASPEEWPTRKYGGYGRIFVETKRAGKIIGELLASEETFSAWGQETGLYFYSRRRPATGVTFLEPLKGGPLTEKLVGRMLADLERQPPELFVTLRRRPPPRDHPVIQWFATRYAALPPDNRIPSFLFYYRRGGSLEARFDQGVPEHLRAGGKVSPSR